ncbi:hypothetical protein Tco_1439959 [Tanacetum coccineum]
MESSSSNSEEKELQHMQQEERKLHSKCIKRLFDVRARLIEDLQMKEREVKAIKEIEKRLNESKMQTQESLVTEDATLEASLVTKGQHWNLESTHDSVPSSEQRDESSSSGNDANAEKILVDTVASNIEYVDIGPSYDSDIVFEVNREA